MTTATTEPDGGNEVKVPAELTRYEAVSALVRLVLGLAVLVGVVALLSWRFREPLERFGRAFVERFGVLGVAGGSFLADGIHFPLPPQFYLFAGEAGGMSRTAAIGSALVGSTLGGLLAFAVARRLSSAPNLERGKGQVTRRVLAVLFQRHGLLGVALAGTLPISYWVLCALSGTLRLPWSAYGVLAVMRVPRLLLSYAVIVAAWEGTG